MAQRILVVSPIPSHPQDQGNSARIFALCRQLQAAGLIVHFLYYQLEGLTPTQRAAMEATWDHCHFLRAELPNTAPTGDGYYRLDDWWDPRVAELAGALHQRYRFRAVMVNYVWFSAVLEAFGPDVLRILDTHDVFGGRDRRFLEAGLVPEWYFTTDQEEARGLQRADIVLAIQHEEAAHLRSHGHADVRVIGHVLERRRRHLPARGDRAPTIGYLASGNPLNIASFERVRTRLVALPHTHSRLVVAGSICERLSSNIRPFVAFGRLDCIDEFYDQVDVVMNPMTVGTGLKIKSVEAIFQGRPLLATRAAMSGLPAMCRYHAFESPEELAEFLPCLRDAQDILVDLAQASCEIAEAYGGEVRAAMQRLVADVAANISA